MVASSQEQNRTVFLIVSGQFLVFQLPFTHRAKFRIASIADTPLIDHRMATPSFRLVHINDPIKNATQGGFLHNRISTAKYNVLTFLFKFLREQFSKYANVFFLFTGLIQVHYQLLACLYRGLNFELK